MKKDLSSKRKLALSLCLGLAALVIAVGGTLAIYTGQAFQRSVVRNRDNEAVRFSSDKLYRVASGSPAQKYYCPMGQHQTAVTFRVCNYDQAKSNLFNEKDIEYNITFAISNGTDGFTYTISDGTTTQTVKNGGSCTFSGVCLNGSQRSVKSYTVPFAETDYNKIEVTVTVTPTDPTLTKGMVLNGILVPIEYAATQGITVNYYFTDSMRDGLGLSDFAAYNLSVSVSGGKTNVVITWDHTRLDIDPFFKKGRTVTTEGDFSSITVSMDAANETGAYLIPFYNHNSQKTNWATWSDLPITVKQADPATP